MKFNALMALLLFGSFVQVQAMEKVPEISMPLYSSGNSLDITNQEFDSISSAGKFKVKTNGFKKPLVFTTKKPSKGVENKEVKQLVTTNHLTGSTAWQDSTMPVTYTLLPFYRNEYWFKFFPLYQHAGSFKQYDTKNEKIYFKNVEPKMVEKGTLIQRSKNLWGWSALGATAIGAIAATAYAANYAMKMFKTDTK